MLTLLPKLPKKIVGLAACGRVTGSNYDGVLIPTVQAALEKHKKLRLLYELSSDFTGLVPGAMWDDMKLVMAHFSAWERVAVVTNVSWVANATNMFKFVMPCTVKVFSLKDRAVAESWIAAHVGTARNVVLVLTYSVVVISILVQGPTIVRVVRGTTS